MRLFKRKIRVIVGESDSPRGALEINNLRMAFEIKKNLDSTPAEGWVSIYNLTEANQAFIAHKADRVRVFAGYGSDLALLFDGDIANIDRARREQDRITTISLGGNLFKLTDAYVSLSFSGPVTLRQIIRKALPTFALSGVQGLDTLPDITKYNYAYSGKTGDMMDSLLHHMEFDWFEEDGTLVILPPDGGFDDRVPLISPATGMLGSPAKTEEGLKVTTLLQPGLRPGGVIKVTAYNPEYSGYWKIRQLYLRGDNRQNQFSAELDCIPYEQ